MAFFTQEDIISQVVQSLHLYCINITNTVDHTKYSENWEYIIKKFDSVDNKNDVISILTNGGLISFNSPKEAKDLFNMFIDDAINDIGLTVRLYDNRGIIVDET